MLISMAVCGLRPEVLRWLLSVFRRRMDCPQWTAMSQLPASILTTLPPKCHPTWGTAASRRPMWPAPHGSRPVAVLSLPTAVTSPPFRPSRARLPRETPSIRSPPRPCDCTRSTGGSKNRMELATENERDGTKHNTLDFFIQALSRMDRSLSLYNIYKRLVR